MLTIRNPRSPTNLEEFLEFHRIEYRRHGEDHHVSENWIGLRCPWCESGGFHLGIHKHSGACNCWKCGSHNPLKALRLLAPKSTSTNLAHVLGFNRLAIREEESDEEKRLVLPKGLQELKPAHKMYLLKRGFNPEELARIWRIQGISQEKTLSWRIFIPIRNKFGKTVSWTTRSIKENSKETRYISASRKEEKVNHKQILYGAEMVRFEVVVTEGPTDTWAVGPGAVATFGLALKESQINAIRKYPVRVILFDSNKEAQKAAEKLARNLSAFPGKTVNVRLESGEDPAEADRREIEEIREAFL